MGVTRADIERALGLCQEAARVGSPSGMGECWRVVQNGAVSATISRSSTFATTRRTVGRPVWVAAAGTPRVPAAISHILVQMCHHEKLIRWENCWRA